MVTAPSSDVNESSVCAGLPDEKISQVIIAKKAPPRDGSVKLLVANTQNGFANKPDSGPERASDRFCNRCGCMVVLNVHVVLINRDLVSMRVSDEGRERCRSGTLFHLFARTSSRARRGEGEISVETLGDEISGYSLPNPFRFWLPLHEQRTRNVNSRAVAPSRKSQACNPPRGRRRVAPIAAFVGRRCKPSLLLSIY